MILSENMVFGGAVLLTATGMLIGWLLRAAFQNRLTRALPSKSRSWKCSQTPAPAEAVAATTPRDPVQGEAAPCVRNTFSLALGHRLSESSRRGDPLSVILARIDNYQEIGDRLGLPVGNEVLNAAGKLFLASVRSMDWVARFDLTTFAFLLPNTTHANALLVAQRLRNNISHANLSAGGMPIQLTLSFGTTEFLLGDGSEEILRRAEEAMDAALRAGGDCIRSEVGRQLEAAEALARA